MPRLTTPDPAKDATRLRVLEVLDGPELPWFTLHAHEVAQRAYRRDEWKDMHVHMALHDLREAGLVEKSIHSGKWGLTVDGRKVLTLSRLGRVLLGTDRMTEIAINAPCPLCNEPVRVFDSFLPYANTVGHTGCVADGTFFPDRIEPESNPW